MSVKKSNTTVFNSNIKWILMSIFMLLLIIVIVRLTTNIPFNVLILNLGAKDQITATTSTTTEPVVSSASPVVEKKKIEVISSSTSPTSHSAIEPVTKNTSSTKTISPSKRKEVLDEEYIAPKKVYSSTTPSRDASYNNSTDEAKDLSTSDQTNGNSPYSYNRSSAYSPKNNTANSSKGVDAKKYNTNSSRYFSQAEMNEFIRQYPNRSTYIHFVNFGSADNEMEGVRSQIIGMLNSNGYYEIDKNWFVYNGYTEIKEVHFGVNGNSAVNFYIPSIKQ